jgi:hypothetical protein
MPLTQRFIKMVEHPQTLFIWFFSHFLSTQTAFKEIFSQVSQGFKDFPPHSQDLIKDDGAYTCQRGRFFFSRTPVTTSGTLTGGTGP